MRTLTHAGISLLCCAIAIQSGAALADFSAGDTSGDLSGSLAPALAPEALENNGAVVGEVYINNGSIFDLQNPDEDKLLYRLANKLHMTTRPQVIEQQLLFTIGENFTAQALEESERVLRSNRYIQEATIQPVRISDGVVDIEVTTSDTWTLVPKLSYSHSGGVSTTDVGIKEMNLLGTGMGIEAVYSSDVDRDSTTLKLVDRHIGNSWYGVKAIYEDSSDGYTRYLDLGKPFYSLDSTSGYGVSLYDNERIDSLYDRGEIAAQFGHKSKTQEFFFGWSKGLRAGWTRRYLTGVAYDEHRFSEVVDGTAPMTIMPTDRKFVYPFVGVEILQDKYEESVNFDQIARIEDRFLGTYFRTKLGLASKGFGSLHDALLFNVEAGTSISRSEKSTMIFSTGFATRWETSDLANTSLTVDAKYYRRQSEKRLLFARVNGTYGHNLDLDKQLFLGGDNGLRGYPLRYQSGDKRALITLEQRFFTDWYPFRLFRVGAAVFFDMGRTWGEGLFGTGNDGLPKDVGAGLRLGNTRSGLGRMLHIDIAYPLDGDDSISNVQFIVKLKQSF